MYYSIVGPQGELWIESVSAEWEISKLKLLFALDFWYDPNRLVLLQDNGVEIHNFNTISEIPGPKVLKLISKKKTTNLHFITTQEFAIERCLLFALKHHYRISQTFMEYVVGKYQNLTAEIIEEKEELGLQNLQDIFEDLTAKKEEIKQTYKNPSLKSNQAIIIQDQKNKSIARNIIEGIRHEQPLEKCWKNTTALKNVLVQVAFGSRNKLALLDTGAQFSCLTLSLAKELKIDHMIDYSITGTVEGVGKTRFLGYLHHIELKLGEATVNSGVFILDSMPEDIVIGTDIMRRHEMVLNFRDKCIHLSNNQQTSTVQFYGYVR